jgi:hypothetical protein
MYNTPIITNINDKKAFTTEDISCLTTPDRCISLPLLFALENNIPVIAINDSTNIMKNDLSLLPWKKHQFFKASNYLEAVGILTCLKSNISINSIKRPVIYTPVIYK